MNTAIVVLVNGTRTQCTTSSLVGRGTCTTVWYCKGLGCALQTLFCNALVALARSRMLDCNWSGNIALLCQLLATHINSVSGLQFFALTQHTRIMPDPGETTQLVRLTH